MNLDPEDREHTYSFLVMEASGRISITYLYGFLFFRKSTVSFEVLMAMKMSVTVVWVVTSCALGRDNFRFSLCSPNSFRNVQFFSHASVTGKKRKEIIFRKAEETAWDA
jgi:hypothetical protein